MAISAKVWEKVKALHMIGKSYSAISKETGVSKAQIGKKIKAENWQKETGKETLVNREVQNIILHDEIKSQKETLNPTEIRVHETEVRDRVTEHKKTFKVAQNYQDLIIEKQDSNLELINMLKDLRDTKMKEAKTPEEAIRLFGSYNAKIDELVNAQDIKYGAEANDKLAMTQGHVERHAPRSIQAVQINHDNLDPDTRPQIENDMDPEEATRLYLDTIN